MTASTPSKPAAGKTAAKGSGKQSAPAPAPKRSGIGSISAIVVLIGAAAAAAALLAGGDVVALYQNAFHPAPSGLHGPYPVNMGTHTIVGNIPREEWDPKNPVAAPLLANGTARVLTNTFVKKWRASDKWDLYSSYFIDRLPPVLTNIYRSKNPYFGPLFRGHKPMTRIEGTEWANPHEVVHMDTRLFFDHVSGRSSPITNGTRTWLYYTGDLNAPFLAKDLEPWRELILRPQGQRVNVWVSDEGVTTHLHVDGYDNFFVQVQGVKRMVLFPPEETLHAPLYPMIHPSFGQAHTHLPGAPSIAKYADSPLPNTPLAGSPAAAALSQVRAAARDALAAGKQALAKATDAARVLVRGAVHALRGSPSADEAAASAAATASAAAAAAAAKVDEAVDEPTDGDILAAVGSDYIPVIPTPACNLTETKYPASQLTPAGEAARLAAAFKSGAGTRLPQGREVVLYPGDLLYIPPNWMHYVETLSPSISVNFWSQALPQRRYDTAVRALVDSAVHAWSQAQKRVAAALVIHGVLTEPAVQKGMHLPEPAHDADTTNADYVRRFVLGHVLARFEPLIAEGTVSITAEGLDECGMEPDLGVAETDVRAHAQMLKLVGLISPETDVDELAEDVAAEEAEAGVPALKTVYRALGEVAARAAREFAQVPARERHVWVGNFVETLAYWSSDPAGKETATALYCIAHFPIDISRSPNDVLV